MSTFPLGWTDDSGPQLFALGWLDIAAVAPVPFTPEPVHPPGMGISPEVKRRILEEDELLIAVIMAFLQIKDD